MLVGEWNLLHDQWLVPVNGVLWHGKLTDGNKDWVWNTYRKYIDADNKNDWFADWGNKNCQIINHLQLLFNKNLLIPTVSCVGLSIIIPIVCRWFKFIEIDVIPFTLTIAIGMFWLIFSGAINQKIGVWLWVIRVFLTIILIFGVFVITNLTINKIMLKMKIGGDVAIEYAQNSKDINDSSEEIKKMVKQSDEITTVEK